MKVIITQATPPATTDEIPRGAGDAFVALALLEDPTRVWTASAVAARLGIGSGHPRITLNKFLTAGVLECEPPEPRRQTKFYRVTEHGTGFLRQVARQGLAATNGGAVASYINFDLVTLLGTAHVLPEAAYEGWHATTVTVLTAFARERGRWLSVLEVHGLTGVSVTATYRHVRKLVAHGFLQSRVPVKRSLGRGKLPETFTLADDVEASVNAIVSRGVTHAPQDRENKQ